MSSSTLALPANALPRAASLMLDMLRGLRHGQLTLTLPNDAPVLVGSGDTRAAMRIEDWQVFDHALSRGDIGFAESYIEGAWEAEDLGALLTLLNRNRDVLKMALYGHWWRLAAYRLRHFLRANTRTGSRRNIMAHYDLGNDFYARWLDAGMSYSAALYREARDGSLEAAQAAKFRRVLDRLPAEPGSRVLEIGCGWGGFAELATEAGLAVTGLTLSPAQLEWARRRVPQADLRLQDYRDTTGQFDHVVSIEMFEAVGERWWPSYFGTVARALKPGGRAVIQSITIRDDLFAAYRKGTDFIQQFIFPGGMLPSRAAFRAHAARQGLAVRDEYAFGADYARTLAAWRAAFEANWPQIAALGFDEPFRRLWRMYLCYCEAGFLAGNIDVVQFELAHG
jgi:cyclopropane-fatty-acyl-phospholipid synthase